MFFLGRTLFVAFITVFGWVSVRMYPYCRIGQEVEYASTVGYARGTGSYERQQVFDGKVMARRDEGRWGVSDKPKQ